MDNAIMTELKYIMTKVGALSRLYNEDDEMAILEELKKRGTELTEQLVEISVHVRCNGIDSLSSMESSIDDDDLRNMIEYLYVAVDREDLLGTFLTRYITKNWDNSWHFDNLLYLMKLVGILMIYDGKHQAVIRKQLYAMIPRYDEGWLSGLFDDISNDKIKYYNNSECNEESAETFKCCYYKGGNNNECVAQRRGVECKYCGVDFDGNTGKMDYYCSLIREHNKKGNGSIEDLIDSDDKEY